MRDKTPYKVLCGTALFAAFASHVDSLMWAKARSADSAFPMMVQHEGRPIARYADGQPVTLTGVHARAVA